MFGSPRNLPFRVSIVVRNAVLILVHAARHMNALHSDDEWVASNFGYIPLDTETEKAPGTNEKGPEVLVPVENEDQLSASTLARVRAVLECTDRDFYPQTAQRGASWVLRNYVRADHGTLPCHETITYTTHATVDFLDNVPPLVKRWLAPVSLAIYAPGTDLAVAIDSIRYLQDCTGSILVKFFVTFHVFFPINHMPSEIPDPEKFLNTYYRCPDKAPYVVNASSTYVKLNKLLYPVNVARNIARDAALTHFILPSDIELYPSPNLVPRFLNMIARNEKPLSTSTGPRVFPISVFEVDAKVKVPTTKTELQAMLKKEMAIPFHKFVCEYCHKIPHAKSWIKAKENSRMTVTTVAKRIGTYQHWEPFYIGTNRDPYFDERLSREGSMNKRVQAVILCLKNYDFMVLSDAFLVHKPGLKVSTLNLPPDEVINTQTRYIENVILPELHRLFGEKKECSV